MVRVLILLKKAKWCRSYYFKDSLSGSYPNDPQCGHLRPIIASRSFWQQAWLGVHTLSTWVHHTLNPELGEFLDRPGSQSFTTPSIRNRQTSNPPNSYGVIPNKLLAAYVQLSLGGARVPCILQEVFPPITCQSSFQPQQPKNHTVTQVTAIFQSSKQKHIFVMQQ